MTALSENLKKYFATKAIDTVSLLLFGFALFSSFIYLNIQHFNWEYIEYVMWAAIILSFVGYGFLSKYTGKWIDKWVVPEMSKDEIKNYHLTDSAFWIILMVIVGYLIKDMIDILLYIGLMALIFIVKEVKKWKRYKALPDENTVVNDDVAKAEEKELMDIIDGKEPEVKEDEPKTKEGDESQEEEKKETNDAAQGESKEETKDAVSGIEIINANEDNHFGKVFCERCEEWVYKETHPCFIKEE